MPRGGLVDEEAGEWREDGGYVAWRCAPSAKPFCPSLPHFAITAAGIGLGCVRGQTHAFLSNKKKRESPKRRHFWLTCGGFWS